MNDYTYELKDGFDYAAKNGDFEKASFITLSAPSFKQIDKFSPIKQAFTAAISEIQDTKETVGDEPASTDSDAISGAQYMALMYRWSGDINKVFIHAGLLFKEVALVDGELRLTTPLMEKMSATDFEGMVGAYIANFIAPSLMDGQ